MVVSARGSLPMKWICIVLTVSKYTDARNLTTIDELIYEMPKAEALNFQKPTNTDFENAYQRLYQIDGGKSEFELMINPTSY
jgi:hypothetical protein